VATANDRTIVEIYTFVIGRNFVTLTTYLSGKLMQSILLYIIWIFTWIPNISYSL